MNDDDKNSSNALLLPQTVMVRVIGFDPKSLKIKHRSFFTHESGKTTLSCSGFHLGNSNYVITSAWLLAPFFKESSDDPSLVGEGGPNFELLNNVKIHVAGENDSEWMDATFEGVITNQATTKSFTRLQDVFLPSAIPIVRRVNICEMAILKLSTPSSSSSSSSSRLFSIPKKVRETLKGTDVTVVSSAYGLVSPSVFKNSITRGVISNVVEKELFYVDARCLAGSEGAPVFESSTGCILGVVLPVVLLDSTSANSNNSGNNNNTFSLGVALPIEAILQEINSLLLGLGASPLTMNPTRSLPNPPPPPPPPPINKLIITNAMDCIALIQLASSWGSGVIINKKKRLILTCAHVVKENTASFPRRIQVTFKNVRSAEVVYKPYFANVLYISDFETTMFDVAVLQVEETLPAFCREVQNRGEGVKGGDDFTPKVNSGEFVYAVGYALFDPYLNYGATITKGTLAKVVYLRKNTPPAMFQTSALVFRGHSGGLLCDEDGKFLGILTSNAKHSDATIIPEINFSIPAPLIFRLIENLETYPPTLLPIFKSLWCLEPTFQHLPLLEETTNAPPPPPRANSGSNSGENNYFLQVLDKFRKSKL